jgi:uncharacterized membrane protein
MTPVMYTLNHWLHLLGAIAAVGGTMLLRFAVHPALKTLEGEARDKFEKTVRRKGQTLVLHSLLLVIITGFINFVRVFNGDPPTFYVVLFFIKFLLAMAIFAILIAMMMPTDAFEKIQANRPRWMLLNVLLGVMVVLISAWLRVHYKL